MTDASPLLHVDDLHVSFPRRGFRVPSTSVLQGVSFSIEPGRTLGLVGESGSGKTTVGRAILGLTPVSQGRIVFDGCDISRLTRSQRRPLAREIQVVFQNPYSSLNPSMTIEDILTEPLQAQPRQERRAMVSSLLNRVQLPADAGRRMAREFSGGQRQRIAIARALVLSPRLIVCDEPTSALDLSTQSRVLDLLTEIQEAEQVAYLFISHDLAVVHQMSHDIAVLRGGEIVESGTSEQVTREPRHPYTKLLQLSAPVPDPDLQRARRERLQAARESAS